MTHPDTVSLNLALAELDVLGFDVSIDDNPGTNWVRLDQYAADPSILDAALRLAGTRFQRAESSSLTGGWLIGDIAAAVAWPAAAALLTQRTLLVSCSADVYLPAPRSQKRLAARIAPRGNRSPAFPDAFAEGMVTTLRPVVDAVHARTRRGRHALWATVTDMIAAAFHRVGDHLQCTDAARDFATATLDGHSSLPGSTNWHDIFWAGGTERTRVRNICCLWYQTPGGELCLTCPRITDPDRIDILNRRRTAS